MRLLRNMIAALAMALFATPSAAVIVRAPARTVVTITSSADREIPVSLVVPTKGTGRLAVNGIILFSHGALSNPDKYAALTDRWAMAGYAVMAPLHADSEAWTGAKPSQAQSTPWRLADMKAVLGNLAKFEKAGGFQLAGKPVVIAGHSFGGLIALLIDDPRIKGVIAFSPPGPLPGFSAPPVTKPILTVTGTADSHPMMAPKWQDHLTAHNAATGRAIAYIGTGADHYFGRIIGRTEYQVPPQINQFTEALAISQMFLRAYMNDDKAAARDLARYKPRHGTIQRR